MPKVVDDACYQNATFCSQQIQSQTKCFKGKNRIAYIDIILKEHLWRFLKSRMDPAPHSWPGLYVSLAFLLPRSFSFGAILLDLEVVSSSLLRKSGWVSLTWRPYSVTGTHALTDRRDPDVTTLRTRDRWLLPPPRRQVRVLNGCRFRLGSL